MNSSEIIVQVVTDATNYNRQETLEGEACAASTEPVYYSSLGVALAMPEWEAVFTAVVLSLIILSTVVGNVLVILSVFTYKPLRIVQNFFIVSLAVADLTVALLVLPLNVAYSILGEWVFGIHICKLWLTCDVMCCTSSILNLCAIALDRYWAITDPINYAQKRTLERVMLMIGVVWIVSLIISSPPLLGWNDWPEEFLPDTPCRLTSQPGFVIFSSSGSFYIPLVIMTVVYLEIYIATRRRLRDRARATKISTISFNNRGASKESHDRDSVSSEANHNDHPGTTRLVEDISSDDKKSKKNKKKYWGLENDGKSNRLAVPILADDYSATENRQTSSESNSKETQEEETESRDTKKREALVPPSQRSVYQFIEEKQRISLSRERRAARTLGIIMGVFVVCWLPFFLVYVIGPFCASCCFSSKFINFITWLGYINSALNPLIYTIFNIDFRRAFKKLILMRH